MVEQVLHKFRDDDLRAKLTRLPDPQTAASRYQTAMQFVVDSYGQDALNDLVRDAVLHARSMAVAKSVSLEELDRSHEGWGLPPAVSAIGRIVATHASAFSAPILTTNFDPLLEISIRRAGRQAVTIHLTSDGRFDNLIVHDAAKIVHMHGYWIGSDTLHTPQQIEQPRPQLRGCLRQLLGSATLVVVGYGGWTDVFTRTLMDVVAGGNTDFNVLWTFRSENEEDIQRDHAALLELAAHAAGTRLAFYKGVDCHEFFPRLYNATIQLTFRQNRGDSTPPRTEGIQDFPPSTAAWVGRGPELRRLSGGDNRVIAITGIGGQGKSALAAKFLESRLATHEIDFWDWRDCKEQSHTLNTQLAYIIQRLTDQSTIAPSLQGESTSYLIETLFTVLGERRALLVFDNTDQYVDVERCRFVEGIDLLVSRALRTGHRATFVFTCRPRLEFLGAGYLCIDLHGLTRDDAIRLFELRGVPDVDSPLVRAKIQRVQEITDGHPLWMNVIATQVSQQPDRFDVFLERLERDSNVALPRNLLFEVWDELNNRQQRVLRYMAEMVTAENETRIADFMSPDLNFNQVRRALRTLKSLDLIVTKSSGSDETLELHPLVRQFIRQEFPRNERVKYIHPILRVLEKLIVQFAPAMGAHAAVNHTRYAAAKVELYLNAGQNYEAAQSLLEIEDALVGHGFSEEFVRLAAPLMDEAALAENLTLYDKLIGSTVQILSDLGHFRDADRYLDHLEATIPGKTARYIKLCDLRCYSFWGRREFSRAIEWGRRGDELKTSTSLDTENDCRHHLALARRDSGDVAAALEYFRHGIGTKDLLVGNVPKQWVSDGPFWGNIGRCLQLQGYLPEAAVCLIRSAVALQRDGGHSTVVVNRGWAAKWLGEVSEASGDMPSAHVCFLAAQEYWRRSSPPRADALHADIARVANPARDIPSWQIERAYRDWLDAAIAKQSDSGARIDL